ncbi:DEAD/DEAH box helicase family protein [Candidatus Kaistella beijingensis]|uniref:GIY-YIG nuclease family protein n=1 Tax=Candidatus Kaistella beijingensis TaxID=2820270 RepID=UPI001CC75085|nr:GIY-YIG nuclease family protein [Candidatus Kaistella beijingensis]UBB89346.1 DEAD/DEAH box helicase family protein [Candidatus Kaistella beijingensis]
MPTELFPAKQIPRIYAYQDSRYPNMLKVGYTTKSAQERIKEQYPVNLPSQSYEIVLDELAIREDGTFFTDKVIHKRLKKWEINNAAGEWYSCAKEEVLASIIAERKGIENEQKRTQDFRMRPEQKAAVDKTARYFKSFEDEEGIIPHFLWNAKMRFGKTFASYQLAKEMGWKKILVLTFKPAVLSAWREDLLSHIDFKNWQFVSQKDEDLKEKDIDRKKPFVYFASFQDVLGKDTKTGGIKVKNEWIHNEEWDCVIFDEYHYGAWRENAKDLFGKEEKRDFEQIEAELEEMEMDTPDYFDEKLIPIKTSHYLYLSGTPFRAIGSGEFIEEQIFNWTYSDEQKAKEEWKGDDNPYASLPRMVMLTYQLPEEIQQIALKGEFNEFDLNLFFSADGEGVRAKFKYEDEVQKWLNLIRGQYTETLVDDLKLGKKKPPMPYSDIRLLNVLQHTFWFLPNVASCFAMANLLAQPQNTYYHDYEVVVCAGSAAGIGVEALVPVKKAMGEPLKTKTITLSCGKLTTGVSVKPWTGIFMLRNSSSPETYFQAVFRVQTPWTVKNPDKNSPNSEEIIKHECYVFDFAPTRALSQVASYSNQLDINPNANPETKVADFIKFLPILAYDGSSMKEVDAAEILDIATSGTTATLLAKRWESALLVNVDNVTLQRLLNNAQAMEALSNIEGFRSLNQEIETIINKSEAVKKAKKEASVKGEELSAKEKRELTAEEKETKSLRKQIQEKLIKFATRIPVFMYLTDFREHTLKDVITKLEPELFKRVTGLTVNDFSLLERLGVFNGALMNDAVFKFKRYEDSSLNYTGIDRHHETVIGGFDTTKPVRDFEEMRSS